MAEARGWVVANIGDAYPHAGYEGLLHIRDAYPHAGYEGLVPAVVQPVGRSARALCQLGVYVSKHSPWRVWTTQA